MKKSHYYLRRIHRYVGVVIGVQFILWTVGGLYFSWSDLDEIHGDHLIKQNEFLPLEGISFVSPQIVLNKLKSEDGLDSLISIKVIELMNKPLYQIQYLNIAANDKVIKTRLASAETGELRGEITEMEAVDIAGSHMYPNAKIKKIEYLESTGEHHEYRNQALPAWAISFDHEENPVVYVSTELGTLQLIRHDSWRFFDLLWMFHTMDYQGRDNFNNVVLRVFSIFGLLTIVSGFTLFYISSPTIRKIRNNIFL
ncbi:MAG: hypothetical protein JXQ96_20140 [Cyclobacteriaceae bacterium]